jgi:hypothetical protein
VQYKAKAAVCSEIHTKHKNAMEDYVQLFNVKPGGTLNYRLAVKGSVDGVVTCAKQISCDKGRAH